MLVQRVFFNISGVGVVYEKLWILDPWWSSYQGVYGIFERFSHCKYENEEILFQTVTNGI